MLKPIFKATLYALEGLKACFQTERAFRQELGLCCLFGVLSCCLSIDWSLRLLLWSSLILILVTELLNSAIEAVVNLVSPTFHPLAKRAKDMAAASVFLSFVYFAALWGYMGYLLLLNEPCS